MASFQNSISLVEGLADALNAHDMERARSFLSDNLKFQGVFGQPIDGADAYIDAMGKLGAQQIVSKVFAEEMEACCFYDLIVPSNENITIFGAAWFKIVNGRISVIRVVFDPTPLFGKQTS